MKKLILYFIITLFSVGEVLANTAEKEYPSTQGSEFYFSFNKARPGREKNMKLTVSSAKDGKLLVTDALGASVTRTFTAGTTTINLAYADNNDANEVVYLTGLTSCYTKDDYVNSDRGYIVQSFDTDGITPLKISLYAGLSGSSTTDAANVYPIEALGNEYYVLSHLGFQQSGDILSSEALLVATENNTIVEIIPTCLLSDQSASEDIKNKTITLNKGQSYQIRALGLEDLTGTVIRTKNDENISGNKCKKLAVFTGNQHGWPGDYEYEQIFPTHLWGTKYLIDAPQDNGSNVVRVVASKPCTNVTINGTVVATLNQTDYYDYILAVSSSCYIETDKPVGVAMYTADFISRNQGSGEDAAMIVLAPIEQNLDSIIFTGLTGSTTTDKVSIIAPTEDIDFVTLYQLVGITWSPISLSGGWTTISANTSYSSTTYTISQTSTYKIVSTKGGFNAYVYGNGGSQEYGYSVGSAARPMELSFTATDVATGNKVDNEEMKNLEVCMGGELLFDIDVPQSFEKIEWNFGDGEVVTTTGNTTTHRYTTDGIYDITIKVYKTDIECYMENLNLVEEITSQIRIKKEVKTSYAATDYCLGETLTSQRTSNFTSSEVAYKWSTNATTESITLTSPIADYGSSIKVWVATYSTDITSPNYCTSYIDTFYVNVRPIQTAAPIALSPQCKGTTITSTRTSADFGGNTPTYLWSTGETTKTITLADDYGVTKKYWVLSKYNCAIADTFVVSIKPIQTAAPIALSPQCKGTTITSTRTSADFDGNTPTYLWSTGETTKTITLADNYGVTKKYWVLSKDKCAIADTFVVNIINEVTNQITTAPPHVCEGTAVTLQATQSGPVNLYGWFIGSTSIANGTLSVNESPSTTTTYTFKSVGDCQTVTKDIEVKINPAIENLLLTADPIGVQPGQLVTLTATTSSIGSYSYVWSNNVDNPSSTGNVNTDNPNESGNKTYTVTAKDADNLCSATDDITITVGKLPTAITPYSLGANDTFTPGYDCIIFIFNRLGQKIFEDYNQWDGKLQDGGKIADPGVYYYIIADKTSGKALIKGTIEVVKK